MLAARGELEWHAAFLITLGAPYREAEATVVRFNAENAIEATPDGQSTNIYRLCAKCVAKAKRSYPDPVVHVLGARIPSIAQPDTGAEGSPR